MEIPDFYRGRSVLLTGATGFVGKALLEKLLRCCPEVERVYVLVRSKRGADPQQRVNKLLSLPLFAGCPVSRVTGVAGDITLPELGLNPEDRDAVTASVSVVLHSAATVSFQEPLRNAVKLNLEATANVVELARSMKHLACLIHVSTAYSNCDRTEIREEVYSPPADVQEILRRAKEDDEKILDRDTPRLLGRRPNTYTFTKALAENLIAQCAADLPVAIVRPSIIGWSWRDPTPGWADSPNGLIGPFAAVGQGLLRSVYCDPAMVTDMIPVDLVVNTVLAVAWHTALHGANTCIVYNCVSGASNPVQFSDLLQPWLAAMQSSPSRHAVWYPDCTFTSSRRGHELRSAALHMLPAALHDLIARLLGRPATMLKQQRKQKNLLESIGFFGSREWRFSDDNVRRLSAQLSPRDRLLFPMDVAAVDWEAYMKAAARGTKRFLFREEESPRTSEGSRSSIRSANRLYVLHRLTQVAWLSLVVVLVGWLLRPVVEHFYPWRLVRFTRFLIAQHLL